MLQITSFQMASLRAMCWRRFRDIVVTGLSAFEYNPQHIPDEQVPLFAEHAIAEARGVGFATEAGIYDFCIACWYLGTQRLLLEPELRAILTTPDSGESDKADALLDRVLTLVCTK